MVHEDGEVAYRCVSIDCPAQLKERLLHWVSRGCMDVDGLGDEIVDKMIAAGLIHDVADFYQLTVDDIAGLDTGRAYASSNSKRALRRAIPFRWASRRPKDYRRAQQVQEPAARSRAVCFGYPPCG